MATATKQLESIYQEITRQFSGNRLITVAPLDGDPPEKYEITYHITGIYKDDSGEIQSRDNHIVTINIPFGFPHFPPSCKPKTPIFHPDFDPAAICIGDFWEKDRTIGDLILHIGQMISGHVFSTSNAFNEEAAKWYKDSPDRLPFDEQDLTLEEDAFSGKDRHDEQTSEDDMTLLLDDDQVESGEIVPSFDSVFDSDNQQSDELSLADEGQTPVDREAVDTLDESFLETDFDYFGSDDRDQITDEIVPPPPETDESDISPAFDSDRFKLLAKQKRFFELNSELGALSPTHEFNERSRLTEQAKAALQQARDVYNQGSDHEHQGDPGRAYEAFKQVEKIVSDYPGLQEDLERTAQAKELLGDWLDPSAKERDEQAASFVEEDAAIATGERDEPPVKKKSDRRTFFEDTARHTSKLIPYALGAVILIVCSAAALSLYLNTSRLVNAEKKMAECQTILKQNRFSEAERQCQQALDIAKQVQFFRSSARDTLIEDIEAVLQSEVLHQGLAGNLYYDGRYLPKQVVKTVRAFSHFAAQGDTSFAKEDWQEALANYNQALALAEKEPEGIDQEMVFAISQRQKQAQFNTLLRSGDEFIKREKWVLATQDLEQALELAKDLTIENKAEIVASITTRLAEIAVATAHEQGDIAFAEERWQTAAGHYRTAYDAAIKTAGAGDPLVDEIKNLMVKAELYETINSGKTAFTEAQWDQAINNYERAIAILESNSDLLKQSNTEENKKKLARTMLQASVIRDKQEAARFLKEENFQTAIDKLRSIIATIKNSEFRGDPEFTTILKETEQAVAQAQTDLLLAGKISYLEDNFKELFTRHYTASPAESLIDPRVIYEKRLDDRLLFRLECTEIGRGRPLKLVMKYTHNLSTGEWKFYSGND
ncbi:hypothetical protein [Desulfofustis glycolicus]|uniref:Ubiquitin-protein ligase n=1 Tax=Desulfofustis glycolicus DSM 9705 TaxID=1121409 RepID=A0A1M5UXD8_9BACT|nr:hypothetical protein [Desulfofustis glycolicus]SHH67566.1 Ubiquitin-protein ligase [Desulfofustis glycolicus DSM 9705]